MYASIVTKLEFINMPEDLPPILIKNNPVEIGIYEGDICDRDGCQGVIQQTAVENCSCHINPPCSSCTSTTLYCNTCGWDGDHG